MSQIERPDFSKNANHAATAPAFLSVHDIHAYYGESYIVQGVSFDVREGEIVALLGRNGAGKTSTLRAIARLADPNLTRGEIWLDHQPLHLLLPRSLLRVLAHNVNSAFRSGCLALKLETNAGRANLVTGPDAGRMESRLFSKNQAAITRSSFVLPTPP